MSGVLQLENLGALPVASASKQVHYINQKSECLHTTKMLGEYLKIVGNTSNKRLI